jgi:ABC-type arginine/histidine transport system permease subunit
MTLWLLSASIFIGFLVSIPLSIARVSRTSMCAGRCSSTPTCSVARRSISSC